MTELASVTLVNSGATSAASEGQVLIASGPGSVVSGGAGSDMIIASQGGDTLSGGGGSDVFVLVKLPWEPHHITDFTPGTDKLDFRALYQPGGELSGLPGSFYGYLDFVSDGYGGTVIWSTINIGAELVHLDHVTPAQLGMSDWIIDEAGQTLVGSDISDDLAGAGGDDRLFGDAGADTLSGGDGGDYLRGGDGGDLVLGGAGFDDINGNVGDDSCAGGLGDDWVVGGKDNDRLSGEDGDDIVYGNLGNDACDGGTGADLVRGGQGDDVLVGGAGNDWLSGDRGADTITGGAGADVFHTFGEAGLDRVTDFNLAEGDRVQLDPGTTYTLAQVGADTVITMGGGGQMVLAGVQLTSLTPEWIFQP